MTKIVFVKSALLKDLETDKPTAIAKIYEVPNNPNDTEAFLKGKQYAFTELLHQPHDNWLWRKFKGSTINFNRRIDSQYWKYVIIFESVKEPLKNILGA